MLAHAIMTSGNSQSLRDSPVRSASSSVCSVRMKKSEVKSPGRGPKMRDIARLAASVTAADNQKSGSRLRMSRKRKPVMASHMPMV
jgi:hypothetical protein